MFNFTDAKTMSAAAGEAILFELQLCDWAGNVQPIKATARSFAFSIYDASGSSLFYRQSETLTDVSGDFARWVVDGTLSEGLRGKTGLMFEVSERLDNGRDQMMSGSLNILGSAPSIADYDGAPPARYIVRVSRLYDPLFHGVDAAYKFAWEPFHAGGVAPMASTLVADFSMDNLILYSFA